jgi:hypothetical protein
MSNPRVSTNEVLEMAFQAVFHVLEENRIPANAAARVLEGGMSALLRRQPRDTAIERQQAVMLRAYWLVESMRRRCAHRTPGSYP